MKLQHYLLIMTIKEKLNRKNYNLVVSYNNGIRTGYFATHKDFDKKTKIYRTQIEVLNAVTN